METRTIYVPANQFGRYLLAYIWERISCSMGEIKKVNGTYLRVPITLPQGEVSKLERILQNYDLI